MENRKEKLLQGNDVSKWEIDLKDVHLTSDELLKNKTVAKAIMLPQVFVCVKRLLNQSNRCKKCSVI